MSKFKVGDRVKRINCDWGDMTVGTIGVVTGLRPYNNRSNIELDIGGDFSYKPDNFELCPFTLYEILDGMQVVYRDGTVRYVLLGDLYSKHGRQALVNYQKYFTNDLLSHEDSSLDLIKVIDRDGTVLFQREETKKITLELTDNQIENLKQLGIEVCDGN